MQLAEMQNLLASLLCRISRTQIPITRFPLISPTERSFPNFNRYSNFLSISRTGFCSAWRFEFYIRLLLCYCLLGCIRWSSLLSLWIKSQSVTIERKAIQQHFLVVLFIMLYKVLLTLESVDEISKCDRSDESHWAALHGIVYYAVRDLSNFWVCGWNPKVWTLKWKLLSSTSPWYYLYAVKRWTLF